MTTLQAAKAIAKPVIILKKAGNTKLPTFALYYKDHLALIYTICHFSCLPCVSFVSPGVL